MGGWSIRSISESYNARGHEIEEIINIHNVNQLIRQKSKGSQQVACSVYCTVGNHMHSSDKKEGIVLPAPLRDERAVLGLQQVDQSVMGKKPHRLEEVRSE